MLVFHTHTCLLTLAYHACILTLAYFDTGILRTWMLSLFHGVCVCKCECRSASVEVSVFKGFSGRTLRNAFGKKTTSVPEIPQVFTCAVGLLLRDGCLSLSKRGLTTSKAHPTTTSHHLRRHHVTTRMTTQCNHIAPHRDIAPMWRPPKQHLDTSWRYRAKVNTS